MKKPWGMRVDLFKNLNTLLSKHFGDDIVNLLNDPEVEHTLNPPKDFDVNMKRFLKTDISGSFLHYAMY